MPIGTMQRQSAIDAFNAGNYTRTVLQGSPGDWQWYAALGLIGHAERAIAGLEKFRDSEAIFYTAVAHWIAGNETDAKRLLAPLDTEHARRLLKLISQPKITVLAQLPAIFQGMHRIYSGGLLDSRFDLVLLSDAAARSESDVSALLAAHSPDFFLCQMIEWHQVPRALRAFPCPTIGHTADYDIHIQGAISALTGFDELMVCDHDEHDGVAALSRSPVSVFPKAFACPETLPPVSCGKRDFDLFISGTLFHPYHPDKARLMHQMLSLRDVRLLGFNGYLEEEQYLACLARSRLCVAYYRRSGGMVTRAIESAAMGCVTLVPKGSVVNLYTQPERALIEYDPAGDGIARAVREVLNDYGRHEARAIQAAESLRRELAPARIASQYLRFATVLAARPRRARPAKAEPIDQRHLVILKGWVPAGGRRAGMRRLAAANIRQWRRDVRAGAIAPATACNNILRERSLMILHSLAWANPPDEQGKLFSLERISLPHAGRRAHLIDSFRRACAQFPDRLALRFNYLRMAIHTGSDAHLTAALAMLADTLARPREMWQLAAEDDVLTYDVFPFCFNYRRYLDTVVEVLSGRERSNARLIEIVLASLHHYRARIVGDVADAAAAQALDPDFPFFALDYARRLALSDSADDRAKAAELLLPLARKSFVARAAWSVLKRLETNVPDDTEAGIRRLRDDLIAEDQYISGDSNLLSLVQTPGPAGVLGSRVLVSEPPKDADKAVSILFVDRSAMNWRSFGDMLRKQTLPRADYELIVAEVYDSVPGHVAASCDAVIISNQSDFLESTALAANQALAMARSRVVLVVSGVPDVEPAALASLVKDADAGSERAYLVNAPGGSVLACRRVDLLRWQGFDEHPLRSGVESIVDALVSRLLKAGVAVVQRPGDSAGDGLSKTRRDLLALIDGGTSGPHREDRVLPYKPNPLIVAMASQIAPATAARSTNRLARIWRSFSGR